jgi:hypothetical protein
MKRFTRYTIGTILGLALSSAAWAQQRDLEVTMDVVPANASAGAGTGEIKLPITLPDAASSRGREASAFGLGTANSAREMQGDLGRDFGQGVSETARQRDNTPNLPPQSRRP